MLEIIGLENKNKWLDIVKRFKNHDVYYLPQYTKAFHIHGDGEPTLFYYESENMKAINVVMKRDIADCQYFSQAFAKKTYYDIVTPYGYGGFLIEGGKDNKDLQQLNNEYSAHCQDQGIVSEFVRFHPLLKNHMGMETVYDIVELGRTISMDLSSPEAVSSNIRPRTRKQIHKAEEQGVKFSCGRTWDLFAGFKDMYDKTMDRNNAGKYYYFSRSFYESIMNDMRDNATLSYATHNGNIIAMQIVMCCNRKMYAHLQASITEYRYLSPVALLNYKTALWGCENGFDVFYLGGGVGAAEDSLYKYKSNFNRNSDNRFVTGRKIFDKEKYDYLLSIREKAVRFELNPSFFPGYRAKDADVEVG